MDAANRAGETNRRRTPGLRKSAFADTASTAHFGVYLDSSTGTVTWTPGGGRMVYVRNGARSPTLARVHQLLDTVDVLNGADARSSFAEIRARLAAPLIVALVGRSSSGKSTLLNALVRNRVAATDETECTRVVTLYQDGQPPRVEVFGLDGATSEEPGVRPKSYGRPADEIDYALAYFRCDRLRQDYRVIDTPGLSTNTAQSERATRRALLGPTNMPKADVVLFVTKEVDLLAQEKEFLGDIGATRRNTLFVASCADRAGGNVFDRDPFAIAREIADKMATRHAGLAMDVVPVSGKLAEAGEFGIERSDARSIAGLPPIKDALDWELMSSDPSTSELTRLQELVGQYGVVHGREHAAQGPVYFSDWLSQRSGIDALHHAIKTCFLRTADVLKARTALSNIRTIAQRSGETGWRESVLRALDDAWNDDALHPIRELAAVERLTKWDPQHPLIEEFDEVGGIIPDGTRFGLDADASARDVRRVIEQRIARCQERQLNSPPPAEASALPVLRYSYQLLLPNVEAKSR